MTSRRLADPERRRAASVRLRWAPSALTKRLTTSAALAVAGGVLLLSPALLVFASPLLVALAVWLRGPRPLTARLGVHAPAPLTTEQVPVDLEAEVRTEDALGSVRLAVRPEPFVTVVDDVVVALGGFARGTWLATPTRWGYWQAASLAMTATSVHRAWSARSLTDAPALTVYPPTAAAEQVPPPPHLRARLGSHVSRAPGTGIEFAGIRPYLPGDPVRRVNWTLSSRSDELMLNEYAQERMGDVVLLIDSVHDLGPEGRTTVDVSVRGAASVAQSYLTVADRVGVVAFGSSLRWLMPTTGIRHFYRVVETLLEARQARTYVDPSVDRIPLAVLPSGAVVVVFSPLVEQLAVGAVRDLRERAHPVVVVDVLTEEDIDPVTTTDQLALRIWRLERAAVRSSLERIGVRVVPYAEVAEGSLSWLRLTGQRAGGRR